MEASSPPRGFRILIWLLKVSALGLIPAGTMGFLLGRGRWEYVWSSALIGLIFTVVMWPGFEFTSSWVHQRDPRRSPGMEALASQLRWMLVYVVLLAVATGCVKALVGFSLWENPTSFLIASLMGLLISSVITGYHVTRNLVSTVRDLERAKAQAGFLALEAQLSPHTLFNALNTIAALIPEAPAKAEEATEHLARLLRQVMTALERDTWTLGEEFALLEELLALEQLRFGARLRVALDLDPGESSRVVPPLILLPLVENALKHGFRPKPGSCALRVAAQGGRIQIVDDGVGRPEGAAEGVGLRTVIQRLEAMGARLRWLQAGEGCALEISWR